MAGLAVVWLAWPEPAPGQGPVVAALPEGIFAEDAGETVLSHPVKPVGPGSEDTRREARPLAMEDPHRRGRLGAPAVVHRRIMPSPLE